MRLVPIGMRVHGTVAAPIGLADLTPPIELHDQIAGAALEPEPGIVRHDPPVHVAPRNAPLAGDIAAIDLQMVEARWHRLATVRARGSARPRRQACTQGAAKHARDTRAGG